MMPQVHAPERARLGPAGAVAAPGRRGTVYRQATDLVVAVRTAKLVGQAKHYRRRNLELVEARSNQCVGDLKAEVLARIRRRNKIALGPADPPAAAAEGAPTCRAPSRPAGRRRARCCKPSPRRAGWLDDRLFMLELGGAILSDERLSLRNCGMQGSGQARCAARCAAPRAVRERRHDTRAVRHRAQVLHLIFRPERSPRVPTPPTIITPRSNTLESWSETLTAAERRVEQLQNAAATDLSGRDSPQPPKPRPLSPQPPQQGRDTSATLPAISAHRTFVDTLACPPPPRVARYRSRKSPQRRQPMDVVASLMRVEKQFTGAPAPSPRLFTPARAHVQVLGTRCCAPFPRYRLSRLTR